MSQHKTPLRYPGGKQRLAPFVREILECNDLLGGEYAEPYAGGAGVAMELLLDGSVAKVHLNDACRPVYAFWHSIKTAADKFCRLITAASLTVEEWKRQKEIISKPEQKELLELGFAFFYLNRCNRSGILTGGIIGGVEQMGQWKMNARFPINDLIHRIEAIAAVADCIRLRNWDAEKFVIDYIPRLPEKSLVYCDPPYFHKADRLYLHHYKPADHKRIAVVIQSSIQRPWIVSYDAVPEIELAYSKRGRFTYELQYNAAAAYRGTEVIIFADGMVIPSNSAVKNIDLALSMI